jgi:ribosomal protein S18 acetylase RimI-like enzyme
MLRKGKPKDYDALFAIYMDPTVTPHMVFDATTKKQFAPIFKGLTEFDTLYVYQNPDFELAATCIVCGNETPSEHCVEITTFAVNPKFHHQGVGTKFLTEIINEIRKDEDIKRIELTVTADNEIGLKFFEKQGFEVEGTLKKYLRRGDEEHFVDGMALAKIYD